MMMRESNHHHNTIGSCSHQADDLESYENNHPYVNTNQHSSQEVCQTNSQEMMPSYVITTTNSLSRSNTHLKVANSCMNNGSAAASATYEDES